MHDFDAVTGIQPSGIFHIGNYLGMIKPVAELSAKHDMGIFMADLHALTSHINDTPSIRHNSLLGLASMIACDVNVERSSFFIQSDVPCHAELFWILNCFARLGNLSRMTQFKSRSHSFEHLNLGLFAYPVLMAADILLYNPRFVPVGNDQKQHLEFTIDIANAFNSKYGEVFRIPAISIPANVSRVMSLQDGNKKMSKSDPSEISRITLVDDNDTIQKKIQKAKTSTSDSLSSNMETSSEIRNLVSILAVLTNQSIECILVEYDHKGYAVLKKVLAEAIIETITPIRRKIFELMDNRDFLYAILQTGTAKARSISQRNLAIIKKTIGLL